MVKTFNSISREDFLQVQFGLLNAFRPKKDQLTRKEISIAIKFFTLPDNFKHSKFSSKARNYVVNELADISNASLNQHILALQRKGILVRQADNTLVIAKPLRPLLDKNTKNYEIKFLFNNVRDND